MKTSELKIVLSRLDAFDSPDPELEQYVTPPDIAADVLNQIRLTGDYDTAADLGCGTGILSIGAGLLGLSVHGYDTDPDALSTARDNLAKVEEEHGELDVEFSRSDVVDVDVEADVVLMNPPFGIQERDRNLAFLEKAFETAPDVFALLHRSDKKPGETRQFLKEFATRHSVTASVLRTYTLHLPRTMKFHGKERKAIEVDLYYFNR